MHRRLFLATLTALAMAATAGAREDKQIKVIIITGDHGHAWKETTPFLKNLLTRWRISERLASCRATTGT